MNGLEDRTLKGAGPAEVIDDLHALVAASAGEIAFITVVHVVLDLATGEGAPVSAGHLLPLLAGVGFVDAPRSASAEPPRARSGASRSHADRRCGCSPTG